MEAFNNDRSGKKIPFLMRMISLCLVIAASGYIYTEFKASKNPQTIIEVSKKKEHSIASPKEVASSAHEVSPLSRIVYQEQNGHIDIKKSEIILRKIEQNETLASSKQTSATRKPASLPTTEAKAALSTEFETFSELTFVSDFRYYRIDGKQTTNGTRATLLSSIGPGVSVNLKQVWSENFKSFLGIGVLKTSIESSGSRTITGSKQTLTGIVAGIEYDLSKSFHSSLSLGAKEELFYWAPTAETLEVQKVSIPRIGAGGVFDFYRRHSLLLYVGLDGAYLMPSKRNDYEIRSGQAYAVTLGISQKSKPGSKFNHLKSELYFESQNQNTSIIDREQKTLGLRFKIDWDFWR